MSLFFLGDKVPEGFYFSKITKRLFSFYNSFTIISSYGFPELASRILSSSFYLFLICNSKHKQRFTFLDFHVLLLNAQNPLIIHVFRPVQILLKWSLPVWRETIEVLLHFFGLCTVLALKNRILLLQIVYLKLQFQILFQQFFQGFCVAANNFFPQPGRAEQWQFRWSIRDSVCFQTLQFSTDIVLDNIGNSVHAPSRVKSNVHFFILASSFILFPELAIVYHVGSPDWGLRSYCSHCSKV